MLFPGCTLLSSEERTVRQPDTGERREIDGVVAAVGEGQILKWPERPDDFALRVQTEPDQALHQPSDDRMFKQEASPLGKLPAPADAKRFIQPLGLKFVNLFQFLPGVGERLFGFRGTLLVGPF